MNLSKCYVKRYTSTYGEFDHPLEEYYVYLNGTKIAEFMKEVDAYKYLLRRIRKELT